MDHGQISQLQNVSIDRLPQWSYQETHDFLFIRAELDPNFVEIKRNKLLWESVSARMSEIGYNRTPLQCKSKWKNLVTRYKGCETMQELEMKQQAFPFYNEMQMIFNARMQRVLWLQEAEGGGRGAASPQILADDDGDGEGREKKKRKEKAAAKANSGGSSSSSSTVEGLKEVMEEYMKQQMEMERQWMKAYEERERRRREREMEWRQRMEALENERLMMRRRWREREEQRKMREEGRAVRRDALVTALLNKIRREGM